MFESIYRVCEEAGHCEEMYELFQSARWVLSVLENWTLCVLGQAVKEVTEDVPSQEADRNEGTREENRRLDEECKFGVRKIAKAAL